MDLQEYQDRVKQLATFPGESGWDQMPRQITYAAYAVAADGCRGRLVDEIKIAGMQAIGGRGLITSEANRQRILQALGNIMGGVALMAMIAGVTLDEVAERTMSEFEAIRKETLAARAQADGPSIPIA